MFGWGPFPQMGVEGIAIATILIQLGIVLYVIMKVRQSSLGQQLRFKYFKPAGFVTRSNTSGITLYDQHDVHRIEFLRNFIFYFRLRQSAVAPLVYLQELFKLCYCRR